MIVVAVGAAALSGCATNLFDPSYNPYARPDPTSLQAADGVVTGAERAILHFDERFERATY